MAGIDEAFWISSALLGGNLLSSRAQSRAARQASAEQTRASLLGLAEQKRQFDAVQELLRPYVAAGTTAFERQQAISGVLGPEAQQQALQQVEQLPYFQGLVQQGEEAILQNAAATGGLRGGNVQEALARFRPQLLAQTIQQQYQQLGGISRLGQASATGQAAAGEQFGGNVANLFGQIGQAQAGARLAQGQANANVGNAISQLALLKALGAF